jgi:hypothetical protein
MLPMAVTKVSNNQSLVPTPIDAAQLTVRNKKQEYTMADKTCRQRQNGDF